MPQFATITSFYTFQGNTKARATNVNTNFSNFRGHLLPIDPNTISCIGDTYDVGSVEHRFNKGWFNYIEYDRPTTTCSVTQYSNTAVTAGSLVTQINSVSVSEIGSYYSKVNIPLTSGVSEIKIGEVTISALKHSSFVQNLQTSTAQHDFLCAGVTACSLAPNYGLKRNNNSATTTAGSSYGFIVYNSISGDVISQTGATTITSLAGTITVNTLGRPIIIDVVFRGEYYIDRKTTTVSNLVMDCILDLYSPPGITKLIGDYFEIAKSYETVGTIGIEVGPIGFSGSRRYIVLASASTYNFYCKTSVQNPITGTGANAYYYFRIYGGVISARELL